MPADRDIHRPAPDVFEAARTRRSIRAYTPDPVPLDIVREIVALGRHAPSGSNIQPWRVHVLTGATLKRVGEAGWRWVTPIPGPSSTRSSRRASSWTNMRYFLNEDDGKNRVSSLTLAVESASEYHCFYYVSS